MASIAVFSFVVLAIFGMCESENVKCFERDYGKGGTVCVCNATYCDVQEPLGIFPPRQFYMFTSTKDGQRFNMTKRNFGTKLKSKAVLVTVNSNVTYQKIVGFGGGMTDSAAMNIMKLSPGTRENLISSYFSELGIGFNFIRIPIAGTDFSTRRYTYADTANDMALAKFALGHEDIDFKIPLIKKAMNVSNKEIKLLAAAWTAPPWMKTNNNYNGLGFLREEYFRPWSNYHIRFLEEYHKRGLKIWALSTGNEPISGYIPFYKFNCMGWTPGAQSTWIAEHLGPALKNSKFNETLLIALDDQRFELPWWIDIMFKDDRTSSYIDGIGLHWYWDHLIPALVLDKTHQSYPTKFILSTEASFVKKIWEDQAVQLGMWSRGEQYAENIITDINHWSVGWIDWNLALDEMGGPNWSENFCDSAIIVNSTGDEFYKQPMFYALGHFSKFIPEGSVRIQVHLQKTKVKATGVRTPDDHVVIVLLNKQTQEVPISLSGAPRGIANFVLPAKSITTLIYRDKKVPSWYI